MGYGTFNLYRMNGGSAVAWGTNQVDARNISGIPAAEENRPSH